MFTWRILEIVKIVNKLLQKYLHAQIQVKPNNNSEVPRATLLNFLSSSTTRVICSISERSLYIAFFYG